MSSMGAAPEPDVRAMFDSVAARYDLLNGVLSWGLDRWWRRAAVAAAALRPGDVALDLGCGTGKLAALAAGRCRTIGIDTSAEMLRRARTNEPKVELVQGSAFHLPFRDESFSALISAFVLRNLRDLPAAFLEMSRVLAPGGRLALVDITEPRNRVVRTAFDAYFRMAAPTLGAIVGRRAAYRYLVGSLANLPDADDLTDRLGHAGFSGLSARRVTGGVVTLFTGVRR